MTFKIAFAGARFPREEDETVLDALLRAGQDIPHSCKAGACQSCLMQMQEGSPSPLSQAGLGPNLKVQDYFLACCCTPEGDVSVRLPGIEESSGAAYVIERRMLSPLVMAIWLKVEEPHLYRPGQYVSVSRPSDSLARSYSIANRPQETGNLELHVRLYPNGQMSQWLQRVSSDQELRVRGPAGACFYNPPEAVEDYPLLLAGTGTGLAPLLGVLREALARGHKGPIRLFHGARSAEELYLARLLRDLDAQYPQLECRFSVLECGDEPMDCSGEPIERCVNAALTNLETASTRAYFCGAPDIVKTLKTEAFLAGVPSKAIYSDPFLPPAK